MVERLFLAVPRGCLQFVIVVYPDHTHLLFLTNSSCQVFLLSERIVSCMYGVLIGLTYMYTVLSNSSY